MTASKDDMLWQRLRVFRHHGHSSKWSYEVDHGLDNCCDGYCQVIGYFIPESEARDLWEMKNTIVGDLAYQTTP